MDKIRSWIYFVGGGLLYVYLLYKGWTGDNEFLSEFTIGKGGIFGWALFAIVALCISFYGHAKVIKEYSKIWVWIYGLLLAFILIFEIIVVVIKH